MQHYDFHTFSTPQLANGHQVDQFYNKFFLHNKTPTLDVTVTTPQVPWELTRGPGLQVTVMAAGHMLV